MKRKIALAFALCIAVSLVAVTIAQVYWNRTATYDFNVIGIEAELLEPNGIAYYSKKATTTLQDGKVAITIYQENFYQVWLNVTVTSNATGLKVSATGEYYRCWQDIYNKKWFKVNPGKATIPNALGYNVVDKNLMMYQTVEPWGYGDEPYGNNWGGALQLTFTFDTESVTQPGQYRTTILFQMGFV